MQEIALESLTHVGFVNQDEIYHQENAIRVVREALARTALHMEASIIWLPTNFEKKKSCPKLFRNKIRDGVMNIIGDITDGECDEYIVIVKYLRRRGKFRVLVVKDCDAFC